MADPADIDFSDIPEAAQAPTGRPISGPGAQPEGSVPGPAVGQGKSLLDMPLPELGPEDQQAMRMLMSSDKNIAAAGQHRLSISPAYQSRVKQIEAMSKYAAGLQDTRLKGENVLGAVAQLLHTVDDSDPETLANATGPQNTAEIAEKSPTYVPFTHIPIPWMEGPTTTDPRTDVPVTGPLTHTHRQAILNPDDPKAQAAWDLQQRLTHNVKGITTAVSATIGGGGSAGQTTDAKMKNYDSAAQDFLHASTPEGRQKILHDLVGLIQQDYNLTPNEAYRIVMHHYKGFERQAYATRLQSVPQEVIDDLTRNRDDPDRIESLNRHFNKGRPGMAEDIIRQYDQEHKGEATRPPATTPVPISAPGPTTAAVPPPQPTRRYGAGEGAAGVAPAVPAAFRRPIPAPSMAMPPPSLVDEYGAPRTPPGMVPFPWALPRQPGQ